MQISKPVKRLLPLGLCALVFAGTAYFGVHTAAAQSEEAEDEDYYASITAVQGDELLGQVHDLITTTHSLYVSYSYSRDYAEYLDPGLDGTGVLEFYTHETLTEFVGSSGGSGTWNREHVWPKADSRGLWGQSGGGADLHHIRPSEKDLNNTRGNLRYGKVNNGVAAYSKKSGGGNSQLGGHIGGGAFEPLDNVKGDVARIVMYMYTHYNKYSNVHGSTDGNGSSAYFGTLKLTDIIYASTEAQAQQLLLEWNALDPVDEIEQRRNEGAYGFQGNRNAFIDHPEYADAIWGDTPLGGNAAAERFHEAVAAIVTEGSLAAQLASINAAIQAYNALPASQLGNAQQDIAALQTAVQRYNELIAKYNDDAEDANDLATHRRRAGE